MELNTWEVNARFIIIDGDYFIRGICFWKFWEIWNGISGVYLTQANPASGQTFYSACFDTGNILTTFIHLQVFLSQGWASFKVQWQRLMLSPSDLIILATSDRICAIVVKFARAIHFVWGSISLYIFRLYRKGERKRNKNTYTTAS
jgi:hypothetical protein